jgi:hypothetical protein
VRGCFVSPANAGSITNGSFENTTNFVGDGNDTMSLASGSTVMPGWTVVNNSVAWIGPTNPFLLSASNGSYFLDLQGYSDSGTFGGVTQSISTVTGANYTLTFDLGGATQWGVPASINACAGATCQLDSITAITTNQWDPETLNFTATGGSTLISLIGNDGFAYIDWTMFRSQVVQSAQPFPSPARSRCFALALPVRLRCVVARKTRPNVIRS